MITHSRYIRQEKRIIFRCYTVSCSYEDKVAWCNSYSWVHQLYWADACFILHKQKRLPRKPAWGLEFYYNILKKWLSSLLSENKKAPVKAISELFLSPKGCGRNGTIYHVKNIISSHQEIILINSS